MRKISKLQYRKDKFEVLKALADQIKEDVNELNSNLYILKMVVDKAKTSTKDVEIWNLTKIDKTII
jgi:hypothetical protein